ncbi:hypothetical protein BH11GEM2_BH11GEM2_15630 [soil metagenome]
MSATEARPLAKKAAEMAVQLDPNSAEAHASLATFKLFYEFDWPGCEVELPFNRALISLGVGDTTQALSNLEAALAAESQMMAWIGQDHIFDPLRSEPKFIALLKRVNFAK